MWKAHLVMRLLRWLPVVRSIPVRIAHRTTILSPFPVVAHEASSRARAMRMPAVSNLVSSAASSLRMALRARLILVAVIVLSSAVPAFAQDFMFSSGGGPLTLTISSATAGAQPLDVTDNSTEVSWDADFGVITKMTVSTLCATQAFKLFVSFTVSSWGSGTAGTEVGEVELIDGMLDTDIFRDIPTMLPARSGIATLTYRASATVSAGNSVEHGDDFHTVTYTILAQ